MFGSDIGFALRREDEQIMINVLTETFFNHPIIKSNLCINPLGAARDTEGHRLLRFVRNETAKVIRYIPDYFVVDRKEPEKVYLIDFKCCRTPIIKQSRVDFLRKQVSDSTLTQDVIGQMELDAYETYLKLAEIKVKTAVFVYCAYARPDRMLTCEFVQNLKVLFKGSLITRTITGSGTPFINFDLRKNRSLIDFICDEHKIEREPLNELIKLVLEKLTQRLPSKKPIVGHSRDYW